MHHLDHLSASKRFFIGLVGPMFAFVFRMNYQKFLGVSLAGWIKWLPLLGMLAVRIFRLPVWLLGWLLVLFGLLHAIFWIAKRQSYAWFVADPKPHRGGETAVLTTNRKISLRATGLFAVANREEKVFLRPAEYWQIPLGERIVMVKTPQELFLYQFFEDGAVTRLEGGWLIFGRTPLPSLAVTFCTSWGPAFNDSSLLYYVGSGSDAIPCQSRTIYFTFEDDEAMAWVRGSLEAAMG